MEPTATPELSTTGFDPNSLSKRSTSVEPLHLNVRVTGTDATIFEHLRNRTPNITDSLRVRDSVRTAVFLQAMRDRGTPILVRDEGGHEVEILHHLGVFLPEMAPTKKRVARGR